jgi:transposase-like protein
VNGQWKYLYRAVDRLGHTVDFLLTAKRDHAAARRFLERAIGLHDIPEKITLDKRGAHTAAVQSIIADSGITIERRQSKYLKGASKNCQKRPISTLRCSMYSWVHSRSSVRPWTFLAIFRGALDNLVEQDPRAIKRRTRPMLGFKQFHCAAKLMAGIETMHMIKKGQLDCPKGQVASAADQFYCLAF